MDLESPFVDNAWCFYRSLLKEDPKTPCQTATTLWVDCPLAFSVADLEIWVCRVDSTLCVTHFGGGRFHRFFMKGPRSLEKWPNLTIIYFIGLFHHHRFWKLRFLIENCPDGGGIFWAPIEKITIQTWHLWQDLRYKFYEVFWCFLNMDAYTNILVP